MTIKFLTLVLLLLVGFVGCGDKSDPVGPVENDVVTGTITYTQHVKPIFDDHCVRCHGAAVQGAERNGAPSSVNLDTYVSAAANAERAEARIISGTMPPEGSR